jgi:hypothetical protein
VSAAKRSGDDAHRLLLRGRLLLLKHEFRQN